MTHPLPSTDGAIRTYTGRLFRPLTPAVGDISIVDIAHAQSQIVRFTGHTRVAYFLAQHSVEVSRRCGRSAVASLIGLLHDASEAYLTDIPRPLKHLPEFAPYREAERALMDAVYRRFGLAADVAPHEAAVKRADELMLAVEIRDLMPSREGDRWIELADGEPSLVPVDATAAKALFLERFCALTEALGGGR